MFVFLAHIFNCTFNLFNNNIVGNLVLMRVCFMFFLFFIEYCFTGGD